MLTKCPEAILGHSPKADIALFINGARNVTPNYDNPHERDYQKGAPNFWEPSYHYSRLTLSFGTSAGSVESDSKTSLSLPAFLTGGSRKWQYIIQGLYDYIIGAIFPLFPIYHQTVFCGTLEKRLGIWVCSGASPYC